MTNPSENVIAAIRAEIEQYKKLCRQHSDAAEKSAQMRDRYQALLDGAISEFHRLKGDMR